MSIKKKDGTNYKLRCPNPIMINQSFWNDNDKSIVHNFNPQEFVTKDYEEITDIVFEPIDAEESLESIDVIKEIYIKKQPENLSLSKKNHTEIIYCLPTEICETYDPLYDETRSSFCFGSKFTMEVIFLQRGDLHTIIWNNTAKINNGSIIYIPKDRRWWKVNNVTEQNNGYVISCIPSDLQPSFE